MKRKTYRTSVSKGYSTRLPRRKRRRAGALGYTRQVGYYGRYNTDSKELKFFDGVKTQQQAATTGTIYDDSLLHIVQGISESERIGRKVTVKRISMKGQIELPEQTATSAGSDRLRIVIYKDKQTNGAAATVADLLQSADIDSFRNLENSGRFQFLYDKTIAINASAAAGNGTANDSFNIVRHMKWNKELNLSIEYSSTTGAITELRSNNIGVMCISDQGRATFLYSWRARYTG